MLIEWQTTHVNIFELLKVNNSCSIIYPLQYVKDMIRFKSKLLKTYSALWITESYGILLHPQFCYCITSDITDSMPGNEPF